MAYAYSFYIGTLLIEYGVINNFKGNKIYTAGDVIACLFGIIISFFAMTGVAPFAQAVI
jgi:hypothetical protein